jgi:hypothetical protein
MTNPRSAVGRAFFGQDQYARIALGSFHQTGSSFADIDVHVSARGLAQTAIPDVDNKILSVTGDVAEQADAVRDVLFDRRSRAELWNEPTLPMELQSYLRQLVDDGEVFIHLYFDRSGPQKPFRLFGTTWLAPETMMRRERRGTVTYEQFASKRAFERADYIVHGEPTNVFAEFVSDEILYLRWPLSEPDPKLPPAQVAFKLGREIDREAQHTLLVSQAAAQQTETYLAVARARAGAFAGALERQKTLSARIRDLLFYPGTFEAEVFPWVDAVTDYFAADRIIRSRVAIAEIRRYLFDEFNRQVIGRWCALNDWDPVQLALGLDLFTADDWRAMRVELEAGRLDLDDVRTAVHLELDTSRT